jgi:hypothetical protein
LNSSPLSFSFPIPGIVSTLPFAKYFIEDFCVCVQVDLFCYLFSVVSLSDFGIRVLLAS